MIEAPTTQERYATAIQSSNLRCETAEHSRSSTYPLIAAGWCKSKFGAALMRLQAEWDGAERWGVKVPVKPTKRAIMAEAQVTMKGGIRKITTQSMEAARKKLESYYEAEMRKVMASLKSFKEVRQYLQIKLLLEGRDGDLAEALLLRWLDPACKVCGGTGVKARTQCIKCNSHPGKALIPGGEMGKETLQLMDELADAAGHEQRTYCKN